MAKVEQRHRDVAKACRACITQALADAEARTVERVAAAATKRAGELVSMSEAFVMLEFAAALRSGEWESE